MRRILVLGATSAIAQETMRCFAADGDAFFLLARDAAKLEIIKNDLLTHGAVNVECLAADLVESGRHNSILQQAEASLGGLDMAFIAYGVLGDQRKAEACYKAAYRELNINFLSVVSWLTVLANYFEKNRRGQIIVISSVAGDRGRQSNYIYGTAKGALSIFLQGLRNRLYPAGVSVLTVKPGFVDTPMTQAFKKGPLFVSAATVGRGIYHAAVKKKDVVYLPWFWRVIMWVIRNIPEAVFKRLKL